MIPKEAVNLLTPFHQPALSLFSTSRNRVSSPFYLILFYLI